ncbi:MAG: aminotransferase class V-fold PLP-dependent enzyme, partial [Sporichthyaceae bacterium]
AAAAAALVAATSEADAENARLAVLSERIRAAAGALPDVAVLGPADPAARLAHVVTFSCLYLDGETLVTALDRAGFAVNSGSSCTSDTLAPSHVLEAMGVLTHGNVRVSLPRATVAEDVDRFCAVLPAMLADLREQAGVSGL